MNEQTKTPPSLRKAINDKCKDCSYDPLAPGYWARQVAECNVPKCPLYNVRPLPDGMRHQWQVDPEPGGEEWLRRKAAGDRLRAAMEAKRQP